MTDKYSEMGKKSGGPTGGTCPLCEGDYTHTLRRHLPKCPER